MKMNRNPHADVWRRAPAYSSANPKCGNVQALIHTLNGTSASARYILSVRGPEERESWLHDWREARKLDHPGKLTERDRLVCISQTGYSCPPHSAFLLLTPALAQWL